MRSYLIGAVIAVSVVVGWRTVFRWVWRFLHRRRRIAVGHLLRVFELVLEQGQRISYRKLVTSPRIFGRSYGLVLFKEGPNEPTAKKAPGLFTEPLDDPPATTEVGEGDGDA